MNVARGYRMCHTLSGAKLSGIVCLHSGSSPCTPPLPATFQTWTAAGHLGAKESSLTGDVTIRLKNVPYPCSRDKSPHRPWLVCLREHFYIRNPYRVFKRGLPCGILGWAEWVHIFLQGYQIIFPRSPGLPDSRFYGPFFI